MLFAPPIHIAIRRMPNFNHLSIHVQMRELRTGVFGSGVDEPPYNGKEEDTDKNNAVVVHGRGGGWVNVCLLYH